MSAAPALEASTPALAQPKPWRVRQIRRPRSARGARRSRRARPRRAAGPCRARRRAGRRAARRDVGERDHAALGLGDDLVRHDEHVGRQQLDAARRQQRGEVVPRPHLGQAGERLERDHAAGAAESRRASSSRVRGAPSGRAASASRSARRSSGVSTSSRASGSPPPARPCRRRAPARRGGRRSRAERRLDHVGRGEQQRVGPGAVAVRDDHDARAALAGEQLGRPRRGPAPGNRRARAAPGRHRRRAPPAPRSSPRRTGRPRADRGRRRRRARVRRTRRVAPRSRR